MYHLFYTKDIIKSLFILTWLIRQYANIYHYYRGVDTQIVDWGWAVSNQDHFYIVSAKAV